MENIDDFITEDALDGVASSNVLAMATCLVQGFTPCDTRLVDEDRCHALLPPMPPMRGQPSLTPKNKATYAVDGEAGTFAVRFIPPAFPGRSPTQRFFSIYTEPPVERSSSETESAFFVCQAGDAAQMAGPAPVAKREKIRSRAVTCGCLASAGTRINNVAKGTPWNLYWGQRWEDEKDFFAVAPFQRVNHFPGTWSICRKDNLARQLRRADQRCKGAFSFAPTTYFLPVDLPLLQKDVRQGGIFIVKPPNASCGRGISLFAGKIPPFALQPVPVTRNSPFTEGPPADGEAEVDDDGDGQAAAEEEMEQLLVQKYIPHPLLINGYKFDLRLYVVCTCFDPLKVFLFNDGLVRFATCPFPPAGEIKASLDNVFAHLTNFSINKKSEDFRKTTEDEDGGGSKWSLYALKRYFEQQPGWDWGACWRRVEKVVVKTLIACEDVVCPQVGMYVKHRNTCFQIYGFDVMIDDNFDAHLIEVNAPPAMSCGGALDKHVKGHMLADMFTLVGIPLVDKKQFLEAWAKDKENAANTKATPPGSSSNISAKEALLQQANNQSTKPTRFIADKMKKGGRVYFSQFASEDDKAVIREAEEELRRAGGYTRIFPTAELSKELAPLFSQQRHFNEMLWLWEGEKAVFTEEQRAAAVRWLRGDGPYVAAEIAPKKVGSSKPRPLPRVAVSTKATARPRSHSTPSVREAVPAVTRRRPEAARPVPKAPIAMQTFQFIQVPR